MAEEPTPEEIHLLRAYNSVDWISGTGADTHVLLSLHERGLLERRRRRKPQPSLYRTSDKGRHALEAAGINAIPVQWGR